MNTKAACLAFLLLPLLSSSGCRPESKSDFDPRQQGVNTYSETELSELIVPGMTVTDLTNKFGPPGSMVDMDRNTVLFTYNFPLEPREESLHLAGFSIYIKDGRVLRWTPITGESQQTFQAGGSQATLGEHSFQLFLATNHTNIVNAVDSGGIVDAGALTASPDMELRSGVFTGNSVSGLPGEQTVILVLSASDASALKKLTEANVGKRLLLVNRGKIIAAPVISEPLDSRQLVFTIKNPTVLRALRTE